MAEADLQCGAIARGLRDLETVLARPFTAKALDLDENALTSRHRDVLVRLRKSLSQYLERGGDLVYVGLIGHFSAGKSSTINSLLDLWHSPGARPTGLHPTDKVITLITHHDNANSILGITSGGSVPIRLQTLDHPLLHGLVLVDTPGTGDPHLVEEMARDFLPVCDLVLFFLSAASPLDETDMPLLRELHRRLPFIPLLFVVTRADELRKDPGHALSVGNLDGPRATAFLAEVLSRLAPLLEPAQLDHGQFSLIDNKTGFNVPELRATLMQRADPNNMSGRLRMHSHKVHFFLQNAKELKGFFSGFLDGKLSEISKIVSGAERNILHYNEGVAISNNNLTKSWFDRHASLLELRDRAAERLKPLSLLPDELSQLGGVPQARESMSASLQREAEFIAGRITQQIMLAGFTLVRNELDRVVRNVREADLDKISPVSHGLVPISVPWTLADIDLVPTRTMSRHGNEVRVAMRASLLDYVLDARKMLEDLRRVIEQKTVVERCEDTIGEAQRSLQQDLETYFQNVHVYRAGVFSISTRDSVAKLGIGHELDQLEIEFTEADKDAMVLAAKLDLFPSFVDIVASAGNALRDLLDRVRAVDEMLAVCRVEGPPSIDDSVVGGAGEWVPFFIDELKKNLQGETDAFIGIAHTRLAGVIATGLHGYREAVGAARRARRNAYLISGGIGGGLSVLGYVCYGLLTKSAGNSVLEVLVLGAVANLLGDSIGLGIAALRDNYPKRKESLKSDHAAMIGGAVQAVIAEMVTGHKFSCLEPGALVAKLRAVYIRLASAPSDDTWVVSARAAYVQLREVYSRLSEVRSGYLGVVEELVKACGRYFVDPEANLRTLRTFAQSVKARAIEPSFELLRQTSQRLQEVKQAIARIEFV